MISIILSLLAFFLGGAYIAIINARAARRLEIARVQSRKLHLCECCDHHFGTHKKDNYNRELDLVCKVNGCPCFQFIGISPAGKYITGEIEND